MLCQRELANGGIAQQYDVMRTIVSSAINAGKCFKSDSTTAVGIRPCFTFFETAMIDSCYQKQAAGCHYYE